MIAGMAGRALLAATRKTAKKAVGEFTSIVDFMLRWIVVKGDASKKDGWFTMLGRAVLYQVSGVLWTLEMRTQRTV